MRGFKPICVALALTAVLCAATAAQATVLYSQNFDSFSDGTSVTAAGFVDWGSSGIPTVQGGKATVSSGYVDMLLNIGNVFALGNQARIEFDSVSYQQEDCFFGPGTAASLNMNYGQTLGFEHGADRLYNMSAAFDYGYQATAGVTNPLPAHWMIDLSLAGDQLTWSATYNGAPLLAGPSFQKTFTMNDGRGINTFEWSTLGGQG
ncbi:MAG: hypothetical protein NT031_01780, partial [Planctomycetota bacterium]|nr:hypothetical protein [Planctomycetota bacterium]